MHRPQNLTLSVLKFLTSEMAELSTTTVDEVLNKLKSNGTFDYFRKTCLESIEAEVRSDYLLQEVFYRKYPTPHCSAAIFQSLWRAY